jgi:hypothetical protein
MFPSPGKGRPTLSSVVADNRPFGVVVDQQKKHESAQSVCAGFSASEEVAERSAHAETDVGPP